MVQRNRLSRSEITVYKYMMLEDFAYAVTPLNVMSQSINVYVII